MTRKGITKVVAVAALSVLSYGGVCAGEGRTTQTTLIAPVKDSRVTTLANAQGKLIVKVQEKDPSTMFTGDLKVTIITPEGAKNRYSVAKNSPIEIAFKDHGYGKYRAILTTHVGTGTGANDLDFDQEALWSQGWAPSDSHSFVNPQERDFSIELSVDVDSGNQDTDKDVVFEITPLNTAQLSNAPKATLPLSAAKHPEPLLPHQAIEPMTPCATCTALYTTPGTPYYQNTIWYNNCLTNPPCT